MSPAGNLWGHAREALGLPERCPVCHRWVPRHEIKARPTNTAYCDPSRNLLTSCEDCHQEYCDMIQDQWEDYWSGRL